MMSKLPEHKMMDHKGLISTEHLPKFSVTHILGQDACHCCEERYTQAERKTVH